MGKYLFKKICGLFVVLFGVSVLTFGLTSMIQGNPAEIVLRQAGHDATLEEIALMEARLGLDRTLAGQYLHWLSNVVRLDFGTSYITRRPVIDEIALRLPPTLWLSVSSFGLMILLSVPVSILAVSCHGRWPDKVIGVITFTFMGVPGFVLGMVLMYFISVYFELLPMVGDITAARFVLPVITLALPMACRYVRIIKAALLEILREDYIFLLRVQGLRERTVLMGNALKNALIPIVNLMGLSLGALVGGSIVVESIFSWPGLGSFLLASIGNRDYPIVIAYVLLMATVFVVINFLVDILTCFLDPRISFRNTGPL